MKVDPQQQSDPYDMIFQFVFSRLRSEKKSKKSPNFNPDKGGLSEGLAWIAMNPTLYPLDQAFSQFEKEIDSATTFVDYTFSDDQEVGGESEGGARLQIGLSSLMQMISNPYGFAKGASDRFKSQRLWASIGGFANKSMDGALFSLWSRKLGLDSQVSANIGKAFAEPTKGNLMISKDEALERVKDLTAERIYKEMNNSALSKEKIIEIINQTSDIEDKQTRIDTVVQELQNINISQGEAKQIAEEIWDSDQATSLWNQSESKIDKKAQEEALKIMAAEFEKEGDSKRAEKAKKYLSDLALGNPSTPGARMGRTILTLKWMQEGIFEGDFAKKFVVGDFKALNLIQQKAVTVYKNGNPLVIDGKEQKEIVIVPQDNPFGKVLGDLYYLHPVNLVKGTLWDGSLWLKLATKNGKVNGNSVFYFLHKMAPKKALEPIFKWIKEKVFDAIWKVLGFDVVINAIKKAITKIVAQVLNIGIPGLGILINILLNAFLDKIMEFFVQIMVVIVLFFFALVLVIFNNAATNILSLGYI
jgi:hypothetical protein